MKLAKYNTVFFNVRHGTIDTTVYVYTVPRELGRDSYCGGYQHNGGRGNYDHRPRDNYYDTPFFLRFGYNGSENGNFDRGGGSGNGGQRTCFMCGSTGHHAKQCPKAS